MIKSVRRLRPAPDGPAPNDGLTPRSRKVATILPIASRLFLERGYDEVTMDMAAKAAGVSKATVYLHFPGKKSLFTAMILEETRRLNERIWLPYGEDDAVEDVLRRVAENFFSVFLTDRTFAIKRTILGALRRFPEAGRLVFESGSNDMARKIAAFLTHAHERGRLDTPDPMLAAKLLMGLIRSDFEVRGDFAVEPPGQAEIDVSIEATIETFLARYGRGQGPRPFADM